MVNSAFSLFLTSSQDLRNSQFRQMDSAIAAVDTQSFSASMSLCRQASLGCKVLLEDTLQKRLLTYDIHAAVVTVFLRWAVGALILQTLHPARNAEVVRRRRRSLVRVYGSMTMVLIWSMGHILNHLCLMSVRMLLQAQHSN